MVDQGGRTGDDPDRKDHDYRRGDQATPANALPGSGRWRRRLSRGECPGRLRRWARRLRRCGSGGLGRLHGRAISVTVIAAAHLPPHALGQRALLLRSPGAALAAAGLALGAAALALGGRLDLRERVIPVRTAAHAPPPRLAR